MPLEQADKLLTVQEVARQLRVDPTTVRRWIKNGSLPAMSFPEKKNRQRQIHRIRKSVLAGLLKVGPEMGRNQHGE